MKLRQSTRSGLWLLPYVFDERSDLWLREQYRCDIIRNQLPTPRKLPYGTVIFPFVGVNCAIFYCHRCTVYWCERVCKTSGEIVGYMRVFFSVFFFEQVRKILFSWLLDEFFSDVRCLSFRDDVIRLVFTPASTAYLDIYYEQYYCSATCSLYFVDFTNSLIVYK